MGPNEELSLVQEIQRSLDGILPGGGGMSFFISIILLMGGIILLTALAIRLNRIIFKKLIRSNDLRMKYFRSLFDFVIILCAVIITGMCFGNTETLGRVLLGSTGLIVAIVGFAAQSTLGDVVAGLMMGITKPFRLGDRIMLESSGISGTVRDMTIRHTVIHQFDGLYVVVPNSVINKEVLHNYSYKGDLTGSYLQFDISYGSDVGQAIRIIHEAVVGCRYTVESVGDNPEHKRAAVYVTGFGSSSVILRTTVWARNSDENFLACSAIRLRVKREFERHGIEIPYNFMNIVMRDKNEGAREGDGKVRAAVPEDAERLTFTSAKPEESELSEEEKRFRHLMEKVETFSKRYSLSRREAGQLRLLSEEMFSMLTSYTGSKDVNCGFRLRGQICEVRLTAQANLNPEARRELLSVSTGSSLRKNMLEFLQDVVDDYRRGGGAPQNGRWSMRQYERQLAQSGGSEAERDELEKSIITKLADDVQIGVRNGRVEIVAYKKLWTAVA